MSRPPWASSTISLFSSSLEEQPAKKPFVGTPLLAASVTISPKYSEENSEGLYTGTSRTLFMPSFSASSPWSEYISFLCTVFFGAIFASTLRFSISMRIAVISASPSMEEFFIPNTSATVFPIFSKSVLFPQAEREEFFPPAPCAEFRLS